MVTMTSSATEKVQDFIQQHGVEGDAGLRVAVLPGRCSGFQYGLNVEDGPEADDEVLDVNGVKVFVDAFSAQYIGRCRDRLRHEHDGSRLHLPESQGERRLWVRELVHGLTLYDNRHP